MADLIPDLPKTDTQTRDYLVAAAKGALGALPWVGGFLGELLGTVIPNQRLDRLVDFATQLDRKLQAAEVSIESLSSRQDASAELLEEAMRQATAPSSQMRRAYLANLVATGVQEAGTSAMRTSHFLRLVAQLSDLEILMLAAQSGNDGALAAVERSTGEADSLSALKLALSARLVANGMLELEDEQNSIFNTPIDQSHDESSRWLKSILPKPTPKFVVTDAGREFLKFLDDESIPTQ